MKKLLWLLPFFFVGCTKQSTHEIKCWKYITRGVNDPQPPVTYHVLSSGPIWLFRQADGTMLVYHDINGEIQFIRLMDYEGNTYNECGVN